MKNYLQTSSNSVLACEATRIANTAENLKTLNTKLCKPELNNMRKKDRYKIMSLFINYIITILEEQISNGIDKNFLKCLLMLK
uniref:Uncharacterized protein n=1 Tax=Anopheles funestus TaxID=62324 RepID=A0A182R3D9_ANOFN